MHWLIEVERLGNLFVLVWPLRAVLLLYQKVTRLTSVLFCPLLLCPFPLSYFPSTVHDRAKRKCRKRDCSVCTGELWTYRKVQFKDMQSAALNAKRGSAQCIDFFGRQMETRHVIGPS